VFNLLYPRQRARSVRAHYRPCFECLEGRWVPAAIRWVNPAGQNALWSNPANWDLNRVPTADDEVIFSGARDTSSIVDQNEAFAGTVFQVRMEATYTQTLQLARDLEVTNLFEQRNGIVGTNDATGGNLIIRGPTLGFSQYE
jgi:hypothetical protein